VRVPGSPARRVLVVNAGSSSLKLRLVDEGDRVVGRVDLPSVDALADGELAGALADLGAGDGAGAADGVGHRIVHGGGDFREPVVVDDGVRGRLAELTDLAPLHQPAALAALDAVSAALPGLPAVACFDTAFHASLPPEAATYAVPREWRERLGVRRYGFHGLSHSYASRRAAEMLAAASASAARLVTCHLGAGASLAAVRDGRSVDTTMGFTPLDGLVMATRSGSLDPGAVLWLVERQGLAAAEVAEALEHRSGLAALAGTPDMAAVVERAGGGDEAAGLALGVYLHRLRGGIAAMAASLGGVDALVFTGGVGENAPTVRALAVEGLPFLGAAVDPIANAGAGPGTGAGDSDVTAAGAPARVLVVAAREELEIARGVRALLS
jgi:acetate kinase